jgi:hypothetical protein
MVQCNIDTLLEGDMEADNSEVAGRQHGTNTALKGKQHFYDTPPCSRVV